ncbi:histidine kinase [Fulvivirga sp. M361]|uniref:sensor histidine kinase n=1 Tax=Fulvivirga sp. M361 TaxID=2594266 RepID=UPI00117A577D|nr:histidine kinase [Fulvivirga sp. M361]TRX60757.1 histidine kinase [Fulvivirga sp. M361]
MSVNTLVSMYSKTTSSKVFFHCLFWLIYFTLNFVRWGHYFGDYSYSFKSNLVEFPMHIALVYLNLYFLIPRMIPKRIMLYVLVLMASTLAVSLVRIGITYELVTTEIFKESTIEQESLYNIKYVIAVFIGEIYVIGLTMAIKLTMDWVRSEKKSRELEQRNLKTELSLLRSQMQPHFFFNTLNNLYSLTLDKSDQAPETVLRLSELMSYVIYKGKKNKVKLIDEIKHLHCFLDLERLRYDNRLDVSFDIRGEIDHRKIPPLILITFLENAFKHGSSNKLGNITIKIDLTLSKQRIRYRIMNDFKVNPKVSETANSAGGLGIENTKRRLDLLYKDDYDLHLGPEKGKFVVDLDIPTNL